MSTLQAGFAKVKTTPDFPVGMSGYGCDATRLWEKIEEDLYKVLNSLGIGILGAGGSTSVLAVNVEYAYTHIAGIACATSTNCMIARRASTRIEANEKITPMTSPNWFGDR